MAEPLLKDEKVKTLKGFAKGSFLLPALVVNAIIDLLSH